MHFVSSLLSFFYLQTMDPANIDQKCQKLGTEAAFSIMFVSVGMSCFIWQSIRVGWMFYKVRKPIHAVVLFQAVLGVAVTFITLLASLISMDCAFVRIIRASNP